MAALLLCGCSASRSVTRRGVTLVTYNVQNLFDGTEDGTEYADYSVEAGWTADKYYKRLKNLAEVLDNVIQPAPDIIALQEIEGQVVVTDLIRDFLRRPYHVAVAPETESAVRVALISRFQLRAIRVHRSDGVGVVPGSSRTPPVVLWRGREMVDAELDPSRTVSRLSLPGAIRPGISSVGLIRVIVCHWKSQSGGERQTEPQRIQAAALLERLLATGARTDTASLPTASAGSPVATPITLVVGDLNEDVEEFDQHNRAYTTALLPAAESRADRTVDPNGAQRSAARRALFVADNPGAAGPALKGLVAFSPWLAIDNPGSYYHAGRWERLDQALVIPDTDRPGDRPTDISLRPVTDLPLLTVEGRPARYDSRSGRGYSDHLPVIVNFRFGEW